MRCHKIQLDENNVLTVKKLVAVNGQTQKSEYWFKLK